MLRHLLLIPIAIASISAAPRAANLMRDAMTPATALIADKVTTLSGESGDEVVSAAITLAAKDGALTKIAVSQNGRELGLPGTAYAGLSGAKIA